MNPFMLRWAGCITSTARCSLLDMATRRTAAAPAATPTALVAPGSPIASAAPVASASASVSKPAASAAAAPERHNSCRSGT